MSDNTSTCFTGKIGTSQYVNMSDISIAPGFNARKKIDKIEELSADIKARGMFTPLVIMALEKTPGKYTVISGERRYRAQQALGATKVEAKVFTGTHTEAVLLNIVENEARHDLTSYELATSFLKLKHMNMSGAKVAAELVASGRPGFSIGYINNLTGALDALCPEALDVWKDNEGWMTTDLINKLKGMNHEEQAALLEEVRKAGGYKREKKDSGPKVQGDDNKRPSREVELEALAAVKANKEIPNDVRAGMIYALTFSTGEAPILKAGKKIVFDPEAAKEAAKEAREAAKKAAKKDGAEATAD